MTKNLFKNALVFILLIGVLLYFLYLFDFKDFLGFFDTKEHLVNLYKPNKVFYKEDKIYLIDTNHIYDENNPRIFNSFFDFQNFILGLEEKHLIKLPLKKQDILEGQNFIKQYEYKKDDALGKPNFKYYKYSNKCTLKNSLCNFNNKHILKKNNLVENKDRDIYNYKTTTDLFKEEKIDMNEKEIEEEINRLLFDVKEMSSDKDNNRKLKKLYALQRKMTNKNTKDKVTVKKNKMIDDKKLKEFKDEKCNINYLDDVFCGRLENMDLNSRKLNTGLDNICSKEEFKNTDVCKDFNKNKWDDKLFKDFCVKQPNNSYNMDTCLKGEYFKENIMDFH